MTNKNNHMRTTVGLACVVVLLMISGMVGSSNYGRSEVRKTWTSFSGRPLAESETRQRNQTLSEMIAAGAPFLFAVALCGLVTGILGAVVLPEGNAEPWDDEDASDGEQGRRDFAAQLATALPTIAVRLSTTTPERPPITLIDEFVSSTP